MEKRSQKRFRASGKLLLFGEYLVLCGSKALAIPTRFGQTMNVVPTEGAIRWVASTNGISWFTCRFDRQLKIEESSDSTIAQRLQQLFSTLSELNPELDFSNEFLIEADFDMNWGLGSSSTLVSLMAQWSGTDGYKILEKSFGGSGYDVACAQAAGPITYQVANDDRLVTEIMLMQEITDQTIFVWLGKKQDTAQEVLKFDCSKISNQCLTEMTDLVDKAIGAKDISDFERCVCHSEKMVAEILGKEPLKSSRFPDYQFAIKSLGAWGGDFFMATCRNPITAKQYFSDRGYATSFTFSEIEKQAA